MNFGDFRKAAISPEPIYLVVSGQDYFREKILEFCREQVSEVARSFDWNLFDLEEEEAARVVDAARTLPWMSKRRWVYVRNCDAGSSVLKEYSKAPCPSTVLVLEARKKPPGWPRLPTVEPAPSRSAVEWIMSRSRQEGYSVDRAAAQMLMETSGEDYQRLHRELEKQFLLNLDTRRINLESVLEVTFQSREFGVFNLIDAVAAGEASAALKILGRLQEGGMRVSQIVAMLYWNFRRLLVAREMMDEGIPFQRIVGELQIWSYKGKQKKVSSMSRRKLATLLIGLREMDRSIKSSAGDPRRIVERLIIDR